MQYRLIATDLDGTLLDSQKRLSERTKAALRACEAQGVHVVLATGRAKVGVMPLVEEIGGIRYVLTTNGGTVLDLETDTVLYSHGLAPEVVLELIDMVSSYPLMYDVYVDGMGKSQNSFLDNLERYGVTGRIKDMILATREPVGEIRQYVKTCGRPIEKVNLFFADEALRQQIRSLLTGRNELAVTSSLYNNLEINAAGADKGDGLARLARHLGLKREEIIAFGDGENDLTMLKYAGLGVAMANGTEAAKCVADLVAEANDEDGVAKILEQLEKTEEI